MTLIGLLVVIAVAAVILWGIRQIPAMDATLKQFIAVLIYCVIAIMVIIFLARLLGYQGDLRIP